MSEASGGETLVYVGTYTRTTSEGIYLYRLDTSSGALTTAGVSRGHTNPSFLAIGPRQRHLYAVSEVGKHEGKPGGGVSAFAIAAGTGELAFLNRQPSGGSSLCHLSVDATGCYVLAASYGGGSVSMLPVRSDGSLGPVSDFVQHEGSSVTERQKGPHAHSIIPSQDNRFAFVPDLGIDKIQIYQLDLEAGKLRPNDPPWVRVYGGAGPRHFTFHPSGQYAYGINELGNSISAYTYDSDAGALEEVQVVPTLPDDFDGASSCADVHVHASGKFLYGSNRGHDSIVICAIDQATGLLEVIGHEPTRGEHPRNFAIDPTGAIMLVANQDSNNIVSFWIDQATGKLDPTGHVTTVPMPVCLKMIVL